MVEHSGKSAGSTLTVLVALGANAAIGVLKFVAGIFTGSAAMFAEAAHSVADTATEALLLTALRRSSRKPDREHPFGYGKERFFWALIAAVSIFVSGAVFAAYEGSARSCPRSRSRPWPGTPTPCSASRSCSRGSRGCSRCARSAPSRAAAR